MLGQEHVVRALTHALTSGRLHHAYLFTGTRGVGKTTLARILAKCLNCAAGVSATPCGICQPCIEIDAGRFGDLLEVDAATNTRVEEMRELLDNSQYLPVSGRYKVYIIDEVHMLSKHSFNAMLKTLEEPPAHMKFILATTDPQKVPVTVLSRCLQFSLKPMTVDQLVSRLDHILQAEGVPFEAAALRLVARAAGGSVRDSLSVLDQTIAFGGGRVEEQAVAALLGVASEDAVIGLAQALIAGEAVALIAELDRQILAGQSAEGLLQDFARLLQQLALRQLLPGAPADQERNADALADLANRFSSAQLQLCYQIALSGRRDLALAPDEAAGLTMSFVRMLTFLHDSDTPRTAGPSSAGRDPRSRPGADGGASPQDRAPVARTSGAAPSQNPAPPQQSASSAQRAAPAHSAAPTHSLPPSAMTDSEMAKILPFSAQSWLAAVDRLPAAGAALQLARQCVWKGSQGARLALNLPAAHKVLLLGKARLEALLGELAGVAVQLDIALDSGDVDSTPETSVASRDDARRDARLAAAERAIQTDSVVRTMLDTLGGRLVPGSIRPHDEGSVH